MSLVPDDAPKPRHCHIVKWPDFVGYGFNLHAEKGKSGQYIGKVDEASPAELAGLKQNDRIVEVNGVNIGNENHQQVVSRIKAGGDETKLLVVDVETDTYYKNKNIVVRGEMPNVSFLETPVPRPTAVNGTAQKVEAEVNHEKEPEVTNEEEATVAVAAVAVAAETPVTNGTTEEQEAPKPSEPEPQPETVPEPQPEPVTEQSSAPVAAAAVEEVCENDEEVPTTDIFEPDIEDEVTDGLPVSATNEPEPPSESPEPEPSTEPSEEEAVKTPPEEPPTQTITDTEPSVPDTSQVPADPEPEPAAPQTSEPEPVTEPTSVSEPEPTPPAETVVTKEETAVVEAAVVSEAVSATPEPQAAAPTPAAQPTSGGDGVLNLSMSLKEARELVSKRSKKKHEVKSPSINMKDKFEMFQRL